VYNLLPRWNELELWHLLFDSNLIREQLMLVCAHYDRIEIRCKLSALLSAFE
jgi:hypothetical protein